MLTPIEDVTGKSPRRGNLSADVKSSSCNRLISNANNVTSRDEYLPAFHANTSLENEIAPILSSTSSAPAKPFLLHDTNSLNSPRNILQGVALRVLEALNEDEDAEGNNISSPTASRTSIRRYGNRKQTHRHPTLHMSENGSPHHLKHMRIPPLKHSPHSQTAQDGSGTEKHHRKSRRRSNSNCSGDAREMSPSSYICASNSDSECSDVSFSGDGFASNSYYYDSLLTLTSFDSRPNSQLALHEDTPTLAGDNHMNTHTFTHTTFNTTHHHNLHCDLKDDQDHVRGAEEVHKLIRDGSGRLGTKNSIEQSRSANFASTVASPLTKPFPPDGQRPNSNRFRPNLRIVCPPNFVSARPDVAEYVAAPSRVDCGALYSDTAPSLSPLHSPGSTAFIPPTPCDKLLSHDPLKSPIRHPMPSSASQAETAAAQKDVSSDLENLQRYTSAETIESRDQTNMGKCNGIEAIEGMQLVPTTAAPHSGDTNDVSASAKAHEGAHQPLPFPPSSTGQPSTLARKSAEAVLHLEDDLYVDVSHPEPVVASNSMITDGVEFAGSCDDSSSSAFVTAHQPVGDPMSFNPLRLRAASGSESGMIHSLTPSGASPMGLSTFSGSLQLNLINEEMRSNSRNTTVTSNIRAAIMGALSPISSNESRSPSRSLEETANSNRDILQRSRPLSRSLELNFGIFQTSDLGPKDALKSNEVRSVAENTVTSSDELRRASLTQQESLGNTAHTSTARESPTLTTRRRSLTSLAPPGFLEALGMGSAAAAAARPRYPTPPSQAEGNADEESLLISKARRMSSEEDLTFRLAPTSACSACGDDSDGSSNRHYSMMYRRSDMAADNKFSPVAPSAEKLSDRPQRQGPHAFRRGLKHISTHLQESAVINNPAAHLKLMKRSSKDVVHRMSPILACEEGEESGDDERVTKTGKGERDLVAGGGTYCDEDEYSPNDPHEKDAATHHIMLNGARRSWSSCSSAAPIRKGEYGNLIPHTLSDSTRDTDTEIEHNINQIAAYFQQSRRDARLEDTAENTLTSQVLPAVRKESYSSQNADALKIFIPRVRRCTREYKRHHQLLIDDARTHALSTYKRNVAEKAEVNLRSNSITPFGNSTSDLGFVAAGVVEGRIFKITVTFRGAEYTSDAFQMLYSIPVPSKLGLDGCLHVGFRNRYLSVRNELYSIVNGYAMRSGAEHMNQVLIVFTGHSMGGALANIAALDYKVNFGFRNVFCVTFSAAVVFDRKMCSVYNKQMEGRSYRVVAGGDIWPTLYPTKWYTHVDKLMRFKPKSLPN